MRHIALKDLLELSDAGVWGDEDLEKGISVLRSTNFRSDGSIDFNNLSYRGVDEPKRSQKTLTEGDILLEKSGGGPKQPVGRVCLFRGHEKAHAFGNFLSRLRPRRAVVEPQYLFYRLWHFHAAGLTTSYQKQTSGIRNLETKRYLELQIAVPPLPEQRRIVDLLSRAESIVRMRKEAEGIAKEIIPVLFLDMFGDPARNPKGWSTSAVAVVGRVQLGRQRAPKYQSGAFTRPYMRVANVHENRIDTSDVLSMDFNAKDYEQYRLIWGDILLNEGQSIELVGRPAMWRDEIPGCCFQNTLVRFQPKSDRMTPQFALNLFLKYYYDGALSKISSKTSNVAHLGAARFSKLQVICPPIERQAEFSIHFDRGCELEASQASAVKIAELAFQSLLAGVFSE